MINRDIKWTALFSHTGREIYNISKQLGRFPDKVITNNPPGQPGLCEKIKKRELLHVSNRPSADEYMSFLDNEHIITLHGWMRIVPEIICENFDIVNLHPGLITKYPELKGKDPQKRVAEEETKTYSKIGCVIHKVTPTVDDGEVILERSTRNPNTGEKAVVDTLYEMASGMWVDFFDLYSKGTLDEIL